MTKKAVEQKEKVMGLFAREEESSKTEVGSSTDKNPVDPKKTRATASRTEPETQKVDPVVEEKPKFLTTKQAMRGILHCEIGPELYERAALFAYDPQAPVKDMTDLARKCLIAFLEAEEPLLEELKEFQAKNRRSK